MKRQNELVFISEEKLKNISELWNTMSNSIAGLKDLEKLLVD